MKHFGDITKIDGHNLPLVDVITGGSPCQDLSVAGKRAGLAGERSGLFMEQIRIIKEMREESERRLRDSGTDYDRSMVKPRWMVWENVPGAFSSNKGEDFRAVLEETTRVVSKDTVIPEPPKGKWTPSGCILGNGWSIAWRVHDAQFWGVPQRRKRIALVADFGGERAPEILFERKSLSGDTEQGAEKGQEPSTTVGGGADPTSYTLKVRGGAEVDSKGKKAGKGPLVQTELSGTIGVSQDQTLVTAIGFNRERCGAVTMEDAMPTVQAAAGESGNNKPMVAYGVTSKGNGNAFINKDTHTSLSVGGGEPGQGYPCVLQEQPILLATNQNQAQISNTGICNTLPAAMGEGGGYVPMIVDEPKPTVYGVCSYDSNAMKSPNPNSGFYEADTTRTLDNNGGNPACNQGGMIVLEGNGSRPSHLGDGYAESETMYTLNGTEHHGVCVNSSGDDVSAPLDASYYKGCGERQGIEREVVCTMWDGTQVAPTLTSNNADGSQRMPDKENFNAVISVDMGAGKSASQVLADKSPTLATTHYGEPAVCYGFDPGATRDVGVLFLDQTSKTISNGTCPGHHNGVVCGFDVYNQADTGEVSKPLTNIATDSDHIPVVYGLDRASFNQGENAKYNFSVEEEKAQPLVARGPGGVLTTRLDPSVQEIIRE